MSTIVILQNGLPSTDEHGSRGDAEPRQSLLLCMKPLTVAVILHSWWM
jgi:hypothetical protein